MRKRLTLRRVLSPAPAPQEAPKIAPSGSAFAAFRAMATRAGIPSALIDVYTQAAATGAASGIAAQAAAQREPEDLCRLMSISLLRWGDTFWFHHPDVPRGGRAPHLYIYAGEGMYRHCGARGSPRTFAEDRTHVYVTDTVYRYAIMPNSGR